MPYNKTGNIPSIEYRRAAFDEILEHIGEIHILLDVLIDASTTSKQLKKIRQTHKALHAFKDTQLEPLKGVSGI